MIEKKVKIEILTTDFEMVLATDKGETNTKFEQEFANMLKQGMLEIPLLCLFAQTEKIKGVRVFEKALCQIRLRRRQCAREIGDRSPLPLMQPALNLMHKDVPRPSMFDRLRNVPRPFRLASDLIKQDTVVEPRDLCSSLLHKCRIRPCLGKSPHILQVAWRKTFHFGECVPEVACQPVNDPGSPALLCLAYENISADLPIQQYQLTMYREDRPCLRLTDAIQQKTKEFIII